MAKRITQRELRNDSGEIMRALDRGDSFVVTRNGAAVGELVPLRRRQFVPAEKATAAFAGAPPIDSGRLREDVDAALDQDPRPRAEPRRPRGVVDTSVVIDLERVDTAAVPHELAISAVTLAEVAAGPHATSDPAERARRQDRPQRTEATFDPLPFDAAAARAFGRIYAAVAAVGREARGRRALDMLIAATALAADLPLYTRNPDDFTDLAGMLEVRAV